MNASVSPLVPFESCQEFRNKTLNYISDMLEAPLWTATSTFQTALKHMLSYDFQGDASYYFERKKKTVKSYCQIKIPVTHFKHK